jgi:eukaryotic-like serine/threonine-protein kinase
MDMIGRSLKQYSLLEQLGEGGMGVVYKAQDTVLGRFVAIKVLPPAQLLDDNLRQRFHREARAASALNHPSVVTIYETGSVDGIDFIAMEYVTGRTLQSLLRFRRLSVEEAAGYAAQVADALARAHAAGVVHRDIKPGNIMVTEDGLVKVLDFGLARLNEMTQAAAADGATQTFLTRAGAIMGTVAYMSPEQASGQEAGPQSDIFSLGVVLFQMLSGELPFAANSQLAFLHNLHFGAPRDLQALCPEVPPKLAGMVRRMLEKDLAARYASMADVRHDLRPFTGAVSALHHLTEAPTISINESRVALTAPPSMRKAWTRKLLAVSAAVPMALAAGWYVTHADFSRFVKPPAQESFDAATATPHEIYQRARSLLDRHDRKDNPARAIELLELAIEKDPKFALGHATLTEAYRFRHKSQPDPQWLKLMTQSAERAVQLNPDMAASHLAMGMQLMETEKTKEAEASLRHAAELDPRSAAPYGHLAALYMSMRDQRRAAESLDRAIRLNPKDWRPYLDLGVLHYRANPARYAEAAKAWEQARTLSPDNLRVLPNLAAAYHMLDRYEDAASTLQRAIEIDPDPRHYSNLGTLRFFQGRYADAVPPLEKAVELAPNRYLYWGNLADAYRWTPGQKAKAPQTYQRAIQLVREQLALKPSDPTLISTLALYLAKLGEKTGAVAELERLGQVKTAPAAVLYRSSVAYEVAGDRANAIASLERALKAGYAEKEIRNDPELVNLRGDLRYHKLIAGIAR